MQELLQDVLPWAIAFVFLEAVVQLRVGQLLLVRTWPAPARMLGPGLGVAGAWPHAELVAVHDLPFLPAGDGAWFRDPGARAAAPVIVPGELTFVPWAELGAVACNGRKVTVGGRTLVKALSPAGATRLAASLKALAGAGGGRGEILAAQVEASLDPLTLRAFRDRTRRPRLALAAIGSAWSALLVVVLPLAAWTRSLPLAAILALLALGAALAVAAAAVAIALLLRAGSSVGAALGRAAPILLFPPFAARALPLASREAQLLVDPLAALAAVAPARSVAAACRRELVRIGHSRARTAALGLDGFWDLRERAVCSLVERESLELEDVRVPAGEAGAVCVCPLCESSYRVPVASCCECGIPPVSVARGRTGPESG